MAEVERKWAKGEGGLGWARVTITTQIEYDDFKLIFHFIKMQKLFLSF